MVGTNPGKGLGGWPVISKQGSLIKVESAYGWDKEDYVLCKHVVVETMH
jgi:hypothetical protein